MSGAGLPQLLAREESAGADKVERYGDGLRTGFSKRGKITVDGGEPSSVAIILSFSGKYR